MAFRELLKQQRSGGDNFFGSVASASLKSVGEKMDPRNRLFKSGSLLNAFFPNVKGYSASQKTSRLKSPTSTNLMADDKLDSINQSVKITAKNSIVLPSMARDMFLVKQNIIKLVKLQGGAPTTKSGDWFSRQLAREESFESKFGKSKSPTPMVERKKESGLGILGGLALASAALALFGDEIGKTIGTIGLVIAALIGLKAVISAILLMKGVSSLLGGKTPVPVPGKGTKSGLGFKGILGMIAAAAGLSYLNRSSDSPESSPSEMSGDATQSRELSTMNKVITGGVGAFGAYTTYKGVTGVMSAAKATGTAVLDAKTMSVSQLANSKPTTRWGKFLAFVARKSPELWGKVGLRLAQAGALATIPIIGWIGALINLGFGFWTAWQLYELWKEYSKQEDKSDTSPSPVSTQSTTPGSTFDAEMGGTPTQLPQSNEAIPKSNTSTSPTPANMTPRAKQAFDFFVSKGWSPAQAAGIVGNLQAESYANLDDKAVGDGGTAYGIAQWRGVRQKVFEQQYGKPIQKSTFGEQLEYVDWELRNTEKKAGNLLKSTTTPEQAAMVVDKFYERSAGLHLAQRIANATAMSGSTLSAASSQVADNRMAMAFQPPVIVNAPQTTNVSGGGGNSIVASSSVVDQDFMKYLVARTM